MKKLLKQYSEYTKTLNQEEVNYLLQQNPNKLVGGKNCIGLKNTILFYNTIVKGNKSKIFKKYANLIKEVCLADVIYYFDSNNINRF